jgi:hypothetical protein
VKLCQGCIDGAATTPHGNSGPAALKSGRNHLTVNMGFITELATGMPGSTGQIPSAAAPLAEMLRLNGYATATFGEYADHEIGRMLQAFDSPFGWMKPAPSDSGGTRNGMPQIPMAGISLVYSCEDATARERHTTQDFEIAGSGPDFTTFSV